MVGYIFTCPAGYPLAFAVLPGSNTHMYMYTHLTVHPLGISSCQQLGDGSAHCCWVDNLLWMAPLTLLSAGEQSTQTSWRWQPNTPSLKGDPHTKEQEGGRPTFSSFQVPDADGARLGTSYDELLRGVEADTLHRGCVTCQALQREGGSSSELQG